MSGCLIVCVYPMQVALAELGGGLKRSLLQTMEMEWTVPIAGVTPNGDVVGVFD